MDRQSNGSRSDREKREPTEMTAAGFSLLVIGWLIGLVIEPSRLFWDWRDWVVTVPICVGQLLIFAGIARWLWAVMP